MNSRIELIHQYYVEEWTTERIAEESGCTPQTIRNKRDVYNLPDRDRPWTDSDSVLAAVVLSNVAMGASLIGDMRTMASDLLHRTRTVLKHCSQMWLQRYAPHVDVVPPGIGEIPVKRPNLRVKRLSPDALIPIRQTAGSAAVDLHSVVDVRIPAGKQELVATGLAVDIPHGWVGMICPRSGNALKYGITIQNSPGIIDSDYRGEVKVILYNTGATVEEHCVSIGDRVAQMVVTPCFSGEILEVELLDPTERGSGGFGHTGR